MLTQTQAEDLRHKAQDVLLMVIQSKYEVSDREPGSIEPLMMTTIIHGTEEVSRRAVHLEREGREFSVQVGFQLTLWGTIREGKVVMWMDGSLKRSGKLIETIIKSLPLAHVEIGESIWTDQQPPEANS